MVNFAHGSLYMLGAYVAWTVMAHLPRSPAGFALGVAATACVLAALGAGLEIALLRRIYRAPELLQLLATFGVVLMVQDIAQSIWGADDLPLPRPPWMRGFVMLGDERFPSYDLLLIAAGPVVLAALWLLLHRTRWGTLVRAATQDRDMVAALGVDQRVLFTAVFALGSALAGLAGAFLSQIGNVGPSMGQNYIINCFMTVVVGGVGSSVGALFGGLIVGISELLVGGYISSSAQHAVAFIVLIAILMVRPAGLFGVYRGERV